MKTLKLKTKKDLAKSLFLTNMSQKEIADKLNVTEKTISKWVITGAWREERDARELTVERELPRILAQFKELNDSIQARAEGKRFATNAEVQILREYKNMLLSLDNMPLANTVNVLQSFLRFMKTVDIAKAKDFSNYIDVFIQREAQRI